MALHRELREGEKVVWQGMKLARVEPKGFAIYFFAIPWTAFSLFWTAMAAWGTSAMGEAKRYRLGLPDVRVALHLDRHRDDGHTLCSFVPARAHPVCSDGPAGSQTEFRAQPYREFGSCEPDR